MEQERRRRWAPKVRTGCLTCKKRRKRCDEKKPICEICKKGGYVCDGYELLSCQIEPVADTRATQFSTALDIGPRVQLSRDLDSTGTESFAFKFNPTYALICVDQRYTQFFVIRVAPVLATTKQWSSFWETMVPCTSIHDSSIHHAMLALSMAWESKFLAVDHSRVVRQQTSLAIRSSVSQTNSTYNVLVLCRLLAAVSQCEGDWHTAMIHLRHGWRVLIEGVRSGELDPAVLQLFGPTFLSASIHTFDQLDELPHIEPTLQEPFRKLEAIRSRFSKKMATVDWTEIQSDGVRNTIVVSWSLMTRSICSLVYTTKPGQTSPMHASAISIIEVKLKLQANKQTLTLEELCTESDLLFHRLVHALCAKDKEDLVIYEHLQRLRIIIENFLVQVMELNPTVDVDVFWYQEQSLGCDIDRHLLHPSLHEPSSDSVSVDLQLSATLEAERWGSEAYLESICPYRSGFLPTFANFG